MTPDHIPQHWLQGETSNSSSMSLSTDSLCHHRHLIELRPVFPCSTGMTGSDPTQRMGGLVRALLSFDMFCGDDELSDFSNRNLRDGDLTIRL